MEYRALTGFSMLAILVVGQPGCRSPQVDDELNNREELKSPADWFQEIGESSGLHFRHDSGMDGRYLMPQIMGSGGALFDFDNDGDLDVFLVDSGSLEANLPGASNRLFRQDPDGTFEDVTSRSGVGDTAYGMGCAAADIDNDDDIDLYVTNFGRDRLYRNNGDGTFAEIGEHAGVVADGWSTSAAFLDYDRDGFLDLYVARYVDFDPPKACTDLAGRPEYCGPASLAGISDLLFRNRGDGTFLDVSSSSGVGAVAGKGLGVLPGDFNGDGWMDIFVANDGEENFLWTNLQNGRFENDALVRGIALNASGHPEASMGVAAGDIDDDGDVDLFVTHQREETNTLYLNSGEGYFEDRTAGSGLGTSSLAYTGFGTGFLDLDHDGDLDLLAVGGKVIRDSESENVTTGESTSRSGPEREYAEANLLYINDGVGHFRDTSTDAGALVSLLDVSRGAVFGDVDRDGDLDVLVTNCHGPVRLFRNDVPKRGNWVMIRAVDPALRRAAIGAELEIVAGGKSFRRSLLPSFSYLVSNPASVHVGTGKAEQVERVSVLWPDGIREEFGPYPVNQYLLLVKGQGADSGEP